MLVIRIELWPHGDRARARELGRVEIANTGTGSPTVGNYVVQLFKSAAQGARRPGVWKRGRVEGFPRKRLGAYDLLFRALAAVLGSQRNPEAASAFLGTLDRLEGPPGVEDVPGQLLLEGAQS